MFRLPFCFLQRSFKCQKRCSNCFARGLVWGEGFREFYFCRGNAISVKLGGKLKNLHLLRSDSSRSRHSFYLFLTNFYIHHCCARAGVISFHPRALYPNCMNICRTFFSGLWIAEWVLLEKSKNHECNNRPDYKDNLCISQFQQCPSSLAASSSHSSPPPSQAFTFYELITMKQSHKSLFSELQDLQMSWNTLPPELTIWADALQWPGGLKHC